jgi:hypothetical protein
MNLKEQLKIFSQIDSYEFLQKGWEYGIGEPASKEIISLAKDIVTIGFNNNLDIEPIPLTNGGIKLIFFSKIDKNFNMFLDINIQPDSLLYVSLDMPNVLKPFEFKSKFNLNVVNLINYFSKELIKYKNE